MQLRILGDVHITETEPKCTANAHVLNSIVYNLFFELRVIQFVMVTIFVF